MTKMLYLTNVDNISIFHDQYLFFYFKEDNSSDLIFDIDLISYPYSF